MPDHGTVVIVEDNADQREMLCDVVRSQGYQALGFPDGLEALSELDLHPRLCLIIVDLRMPVMGGERFLEALRSHTQWSDLKTLVLTGDTDSATRLRSEGIQVLVKPYDLHDILSYLKQSCPHPSGVHVRPSPTA
jgi:chemotaxis family two-component system sensor histidine kinase/response regulator PixL